MTTLPQPARRPVVSMILPEFERSSGEISRRLFLRDVRIPRPFGFDNPPRLIGWWERNEYCPDGRHLWDAILANGECHLDDDEREHLPFRLTLTCVRCGRIERLSGVSDEDRGHRGGQVSATPIVAGGLRAQQITEEQGLISEWHVFDGDNERVGFMAASVTRRGRRFVLGRLNRPDGDDIKGEAPTAVACLRKLAKASGDAG